MRKATASTSDLDLRGLRCPLPALRTEKALAALAPGTILVVLADDPLAGLDIPHLCHRHGHELLATERERDHHRFTIRRGGTPVSAS